MNISDYIREIRTVEDIDGRKVPIGVDYDSVTVGNCARLDDAQAARFTEIFAAARQEALLNKRQMDEEA